MIPDWSVARDASIRARARMIGLVLAAKMQTETDTSSTWNGLTTECLGSRSM